MTSLPSDERLTVLVQMFWISVSLLESDFEYEFLLAVHLLDKVTSLLTNNNGLYIFILGCKVKKLLCTAASVEYC